MKTKIISGVLLLFINFSINAQNKGTEISRDWTSFVQSISISTDTPKKFKLSADVKVAPDDKNAWAGIWLRIDTKNKERGLFENMRDKPIRLNKWKNYSIEGTIDKNTKTLNFGGLTLYNGKFFFDNFQLLIEDQNGKMQPYSIANSDFEKDIVNNVIPGWNEAISGNRTIRVKEFTITSHTEDKNTSLLITGSNIKETQPESIGDPESKSPQIEAMISMLDDLKARVEYAVKNLKKQHVDHLHDEKANRIGVLVMHLAAAEAYYQVSTFENRGFNEEEKKEWDIPLDLGEKAREKYKGKDIDYYLEIYNKVRKKTIEELRKRDDAWFISVNNGSWGTNQYQWFHVMEHQSSHLGQILFLKKRLPPLKKEIKQTEKMKN
ncbi:MAG: DUF664 domain-containing protein [Flavobacteriaceae bacterium]